MACKTGKVTPWKKNTVIIRIKRYWSVWCQTSDNPVRTRTVYRLARLERAAIGVITLNKPVNKTPKPKIYLPPYRSANIPDGICEAIYPQENIPSTRPWVLLSQLNSPYYMKLVHFRLAWKHTAWTATLIQSKFEKYERYYPKSNMIQYDWIKKQYSGAILEVNLGNFTMLCWDHYNKILISQSLSVKKIALKI